MRPSYYLPKTENNSPAVEAKLRASQLWPILGDVLQKCQTNNLERGPDGGPGVIITLAGGPCEAPGRYKPDNQTWRHIKPHDYWLGWETNSPPTEPDLRRETVHEDYKVPLGDGNEWSIVALTPFGRLGEIPRVSTMTDDCEWSWVVSPAYEAIVKRFSDAWEKRPELHNEWAELAVAALQINYRVDKYILMCCKLLTVDGCYRVVEAAQDIPEVMKQIELKKKEESASSA